MDGAHPLSDLEKKFFIAIEKDCAAQVEDCLNKNVSIDIKNEIGDTPFEVAISDWRYNRDRGAFSTAVLLLQRGASITVEDFISCIASEKFSVNQKNYLIRLFVQRGINLEAKDRFTYETPLVRAFNNEPLPVIKALVMYGASADACLLGWAHWETVRPDALKIILKDFKITLNNIHGALYVCRHRYQEFCRGVGKSVLIKKNGRILFAYLQALRRLGYVSPLDKNTLLDYKYDMRRYCEYWRISPHVPLTLELAKLIAYHAALQQD